MRKIFFSVFTSSFIFLTGVAYADTPLVNSFSASPSSISNDYNVQLSWTMANTTGSELYVACPSGVTLKNTATGGTFTCNARRSVSASNSDSIGLTVTNVSGTTKSITATLYPKDSTGADYDAAAATANFSVTSVAQPITDFSQSSTTMATGGSVTFTWTGIDIPGTNLQYDCTDGLRLLNSGGITLPCGAPAFAQDLAQSGSVTVTAKNTSSGPLSTNVRLLPAIASGLYDATHAHTLSLTVLNASSASRADPSVATFIASPTTATSSAPITFTWTTDNAAGANLEFPCMEAVTYQIVNGSTTTPLSCGVPAFTTMLDAGGSKTVSIVNGLYFTQYVGVLLLPANAQGQYYQTSGRTLRIAILAPGATTIAQPLQGMSNQSTTSTALQSAAPAHANPHAAFLRGLDVGSRGADVSALQTFLALDAAIYPEGTVSGYFGVKTRAAVARFQVRYGLATQGDSGYGYVGPKTRAKMNALTTP